MAGNVTMRMPCRTDPITIIIDSEKPARYNDAAMATERIHIICPVKKIYFKGVKRASSTLTRKPMAIIRALELAITGTEDCIAPTTDSLEVANPCRENTS